MSPAEPVPIDLEALTVADARAMMASPATAQALAKAMYAASKPLLRTATGFFTAFLASSAAPEDALQGLFCRVVRIFASPEPLAEEDETPFMGWLHVAIRHDCLRILKAEAKQDERKKKARRAMGGVKALIPDERVARDEQVARSEALAQADEFLLPLLRPKLQSIYRLWREGMTQEQIAQTLGDSLGNVQARWSQLQTVVATWREEEGLDE
jgi:RNA polymerase sigma factor (sigma-70 family)